MKLLSIGNSFSQDAQETWLYRLAQKNGFDLFMVNLMRGNCSLQTHVEKAAANEDCYDFEINGNAPERQIGLLEALRYDDWDVITVQQVSGLSGEYESYEPYLSQLLKIVRRECPRAKIYFHQTWAYEHGCEHPAFEKYGHDQKRMFACIKEAGAKAAASIPAPILPSGEVIQKIRETIPEFDYQNGGMSLNRDGYHLSLTYGRFAASALWLYILSGRKPITAFDFEGLDPALTQKIIDIVHQW